MADLRAGDFVTAEDVGQVVNDDKSRLSSLDLFSKRRPQRRRRHRPAFALDSEQRRFPCQRQDVELVEVGEVDVFGGADGGEAAMHFVEFVFGGNVDRAAVRHLHAKP